MDERNLLSVGFKNAVAKRRAAWRAISAEIEQLDPSQKSTYDLAVEYKQRIEKEIEKFCYDVLELLKGLI